MTVVFPLVSLAVGAYLWWLLIRKGASLVPFAQRNMSERRQRLGAALESADASQRLLANVQADIERDLGTAQQQAAEIVARARVEADAEAAEIRERGAREAQAELERARADIAAERDAALEQIRRETAGIVVNAAGQVLARSIDDAAHRRLIQASLKQVVRR